MSQPGASGQRHAPRISCCAAARSTRWTRPGPGPRRWRSGRPDRRSRHRRAGRRPDRAGHGGGRARRPDAAAGVHRRSRARVRGRAGAHAVRPGRGPRAGRLPRPDPALRAGPARRRVDHRGRLVHGRVPRRPPSRHDLDRVVPDRPVFLSNRDHHAAWANTRALELAGITASTPDPADGRVEREADGSPAGTLQEGAMGLVQRVVPRPEVADQMAGIVEGQRYLHALGITGWQEAIVGDYAVVPDCFDAYLEADRRGLLTGRVVGALWWQRGRGAEQLPGLIERRERACQRGRFRATSIKIMQDGVLRELHRLDADPVPGRARPRDRRRGPQLLRRGRAPGVRHRHRRGRVPGPLPRHRRPGRARGARRGRGGQGRQRRWARGRHHIAHIQVVHPEDVPRFRDLDVAANCQALWACEEPQMTELTLPFLGPVRAAWQYPFGSLARSGAQLCMGSDWPVSSPDPLWQMHVAVNRTVPPGYPYAPAGTGSSVFLPPGAHHPGRRHRRVHHRLGLRQPRRPRQRLDRGREGRRPGGAGPQPVRLPGGRDRAGPGRPDLRRRPPGARPVGQLAGPAATGTRWCLLTACSNRMPPA